MTIRELFDAAAPNCFFRNQAYKILKTKGSGEAVRYLIAWGGNASILEILNGIETRDVRYELGKTEN